jgi:hypothetical protein
MARALPSFSPKISSERSKNPKGEDEMDTILIMNLVFFVIDTIALRKR